MMNRLPFILLAIFLLIFVSIVESKMSILIWGTLWLVIGRVIIQIFLKQDRKAASIFFFLFFSLYLLYSYIVNYSYVSDPLTDFFYAKDSLHFFEYSEMLGKLPSFNQVLKVSLTDFISRDWKGFAIISGTVAYLSNLIDQNNIIVQKLIVVFFSSMIIPFLYVIASNYLSKRRATTASIVYGLLSYSLFYSAVFIRDTPIGFFFIILIYLFYTPLSLKNIPVFLVISGLTFLVRPEHGIFSLIFLFMYVFLYLRKKESKYTKLLLVPIILLVFFFISDKIEVFFNIIDSTTSSYLIHSMEEAESSSLGASLLKLPWGIRHVAAGLFSQILPFPFYVGLDTNGLGFLPLSIAALFWFFIWVIIFHLLFNRQNRKVIDYRLWLLFIIGVILVLGASANADTRRIMAVNPIFFIVCINIYSSWNRHKIKNVIALTSVMYVFLLFVYNLMKY